VVELKRDMTGQHMELQALRYAAMVSTMTFAQAVETFEQYLSKNPNGLNAAEELSRFLTDEDDEDASSQPERNFNRKVTIILVSSGFSKELTTTVLWLQNQNIDIRCVRMTPYRHEGKLLVQTEQVLPLPEAEEYQIQIAMKQAEATGKHPIVAPMTEEGLTAQIRAKNPPEIAALVEELRTKLRSSGAKSQGLPASISYGVEVEGEFFTLLSIGAQNMWFQLPIRARKALGEERFLTCKQKVNSVVNFFSPKDVSEPSKWASLCPKFQALDGKVDLLVEEFNEVAEIVRDAVAESA
jgi:hypothetical protein